MSVPKFRVVQEPDGRWLVDVRGTLPSGAPFRQRIHPKVSTQRQADAFAASIWRAALDDELRTRQTAKTVGEYAQEWLALRKRRGLSSAVTNQYDLARLLPILGGERLTTLTRARILEAVSELERTGVSKRGGKQLSPRSVRHSYTTLQTMLGDAVSDGLIAVNPATLTSRRDEVPRVKDRDPHWRREAVYEPDEIRALTTDPRIGPAERMAYALEAFAGLRYGEASALRWESWDPDTDPLGRLIVHEAWDSNNGRLKSVKTDNTRWVPVLPELAAALEAWWVSGWRKAYGRAPKSSDLIIPVRDDRKLRYRTKNDGRYLHTKALAELGFAPRRQHDLRRTFITLCRSGGAQTDLLKWVSHGPPSGIIMDDYTSPPWPVLCKQVSFFLVSYAASSAAPSEP